LIDQINKELSNQIKLIEFKNKQRIEDQKDKNLLNQIANSTDESQISSEAA
jgi:hypothetical protein